MTINDIKYLIDNGGNLAIYLGNGKTLRIAKATLIRDSRPRLVIENADASLVVTLTEKTEIQEAWDECGLVLLGEDGECIGVLDSNMP